MKGTEAVAIFTRGVVCFALAVGPVSAGAVRGGEIEAVTQPSEDVTLSFVGPGQIASCLVREGNKVSPGQLLVQQDNAAEQAQLEQLKAQADDTTRIKAAQAQLDQKKVEKKKLEWAVKQGAATALELENANLDVTIAELSLELARFQHEQDKRKHQEVALQIERMKLKSPISGTVEKIFAEVGESVAGLEQVIRIVRTDPLRIEVAVPLAQARGLRAGQRARVVFGGPGAPGSGEGKITHVASVADAASDTLTVRVEVPNPAGRPAGEQVLVRFAEPAPGEKATTKDKE